MYKGHVDSKRLYMFFHKQHTFFVTRAKMNMKYVVVGEREVDKSTGSISNLNIRLTVVCTSIYYPEKIRMSLARIMPLAMSIGLLPMFSLSQKSKRACSSGLAKKRLYLYERFFSAGTYHR